LPLGKRKPPAGEGFAVNRTFSYQQIHATISSKLKEATNNEQRITDNCHLATGDCSSTSVECPLQIHSFLQNKPNLPRFCAKNSLLQEKQTQFKPNQTQFFASFFLPILPVLSKAEGPIHPIQTQPVVSLPALSIIEVSNLSQTTPAILIFKLLFKGIEKNA